MGWFQIDTEQQLFSVHAISQLSQGLMPIFVPPGGQYQYRITPVTVDGVLAARVSRWTSVSQEPGRFEAPTEVRVVQQRGSNLGVTASIALTHKGLPSCQYSIYILPQSERARQIYSRSEPYDLFQKDLDKLEFAMNYTLIIRSTDFTGEEKGEAFRLPFETLTCLEAFRHNFSSCGNYHSQRNDKCRYK